MDFVEGEAALEEEAEAFVFGVGFALGKEGTEVSGVLRFVYLCKGFADGFIRQIQCPQAGLDLHSSPGLVRHFVMYVRPAETGIVEEVVLVQRFLDGTGCFFGDLPFAEFAPEVCGTMFGSGTIGFGFVKPFALR